jgi:type VII secretion-associated serine protease mycosin
MVGSGAWAVVDDSPPPAPVSRSVDRIAAPDQVAGSSGPTLTAAVDTPGGQWRAPTRSGLSGPVSEVLAEAPRRGPVRVVTLVADRDGRPGIRVLTAPSLERAASAVERARRTPGALAVSVDHPVSAATPPVGAVSDDAHRNLQWGLTRLRAERTWRLGRAEGQVVAVVDSGVDATHPDLAGVVTRGVDLVDRGDGRRDPYGHGTHVAGIIAARAGNRIGVAGLADGATILPVRVLTASGKGWMSDIALGVVYAVDHGASVVNLSLAGPHDIPALQAAVRYAQGRGVVLVAAAGNERQHGDPVMYPAAYPGVLAVAATDTDDTSADFSETGSYVSLAAPGVRIAATYPKNRYVFLSGTSAAAPFVSATAALVRAAQPRLAGDQVVARLLATAEDLGGAGRDHQFGAGLVDPFAAVAGAVPDVTGITQDAADLPRVDVPNPSPPETSVTTVPVPAGDGDGGGDRGFRRGRDAVAGHQGFLAGTG